MGFWEGFNKYVGVQGIMALLFVIAFLLAPYFEQPVPEGYTEIMTLILGFYFAKNGPGIVSTVKGSG